METIVLLAAFATSLLSALALYAGSRHCRWRSLDRFHAPGNRVGLATAGLSVLLWTMALGGGAGLCAMLGTWMMAMVALPYLGFLSSPAPDTGAREE